MLDEEGKLSKDARALPQMHCTQRSRHQLPTSRECFRERGEECVYIVTTAILLGSDSLFVTIFPYIARHTDHVDLHDEYTNMISMIWSESTLMYDTMPSHSILGSTMEHMYSDHQESKREETKFDILVSFVLF